jgi:hypothetical protein
MHELHISVVSQFLSQSGSHYQYCNNMLHPHVVEYAIIVLTSEVKHDILKLNVMNTSLTTVVTGAQMLTVICHDLVSSAAGMNNPLKANFN